MSSTTSTPATATAAAVISAKKISNYTQSISTGVTNLLAKLGRVSVSADANVGNHANMAQLQALYTLVEGIRTSIAAVEKSISKGVGDVPDPIEIESGVLYDDRDFTAEEYNTFARRHNATVTGGNETLMPLRTARNTYIVGFPSTLGHLVFLEDTVDAILRKGFGLADGRDELWTFIGANIQSRRMYEWYSTGEALAEMRMHTRIKRNDEIAAAGPPTAKTRKAARKHNRIARAANSSSSHILMPIHDEHNIPVFGWPRRLEMLAQPYRRWDVLYLLGEYGQSVEKEGCMKRFISFVGANEEEVSKWMKVGYGESCPCWEM